MRSLLQFSGWSRRHPTSIAILWGVALVLGALFWLSGGARLTPGIHLLGTSSTSHATAIVNAGVDTRTARIICTHDGLPETPDQRVLSPQPTQRDVNSVLIAAGQCYERQWAEDGLVSTHPGPVAPLVIETSLGHYVGSGATGGHIHGVASDDLLRAERISVPVTLAILLLVTRSPVLALVPLGLALVSVVVSATLAVLVSPGGSMSAYAMNVMVVLGLAVGIDYALLIIMRYRAERRAGAPPARSAEVTMAHAGRAIVIAGTMVIASLAGLLLVPISVFRDIGIAAIVVVSVSLLITFTLLPPLLRHAERLSFARIPGKSGTVRIWRHVIGLPTRYPPVAIVVVLAFIAVLAWQVTGLRAQISMPQNVIPDAVGIASGDPYLDAQIGEAFMSMVDVVMVGETPETIDVSLDKFLMALSESPRYAPLVSIESDAGGTTAITRVLVVFPAGSDEAAGALDYLRQEIFPVIDSDGLEVSMTGPLAVHEEITRMLDTWQPPIVLFVCGVSMISLLLAFRSIALVVVTVGTTLLSTAAGLGLLRLIVQEGMGAATLGLETAPFIEAWVPVVVFCIVFGLSVDYQIFLISRIRELAHAGMPHRLSVSRGVQDVAGVIAGAGLIMITVFASLATGRLAAMQQVGVGLAVTLLLDVFLVRLALVPAILAISRPGRSRE